MPILLSPACLLRQFAAAICIISGTLTGIRAQDAYQFTTVAGKAGTVGSADGNGAEARFYEPVGITVDANGAIYITDSNSATIRKLVGATVTTVAGKAGVMGNIDGPATLARFGQSVLGELYGPRGIVARNDGSLCVVDSGNSTIRVLNSTVVSTLAGNPVSLQIIPFPPNGTYVPFVPVVRDGVGANAAFGAPGSIAIDAQGNLYVSDTGAHVIRKITGAAVSTLTGSVNVAGARDGAKDSALFRNPQGIAVDAAGNLFVVDAGNFTVRRVTPDGTVTTIAGEAGSGGAADGTGGSARFGGTSLPEGIFVRGGNSPGPGGIAIDGGGNLFIADVQNNTIRKITPSGVVTTIGGSAGSSGSADGVGTAARFSFPQSIALDRSGNLYITDRVNNTIRKGTPVYRPQIDTQPKDVSVQAGQSIALSVAASSTLPMAYQWTKNGADIAGATASTFTVAGAQPGDAGNYAVIVINDAGRVTSAAAKVAVGPLATLPAISAQPVAQSVLGGQSLTLAVTASGEPAPTFQWRRDGDVIPGATNATLTIATTQAGDAGSYTVVVTNSAGSVTSTPVAVAVNTSRIVNLSIRTGLSASSPALTVGFVVSGNGKSLLVRGVGPTLQQFGLSDVLADPRIALFADTAALASNDNWGAATNSSQVALTATQVGAFALAAGSNDAALLNTFQGGAYSAQITGPANASGVVLVELYDANSSSAARLANVSARAQVGTGNNILVAGFSISGNRAKTLLIRAIGPTLATFGVSGVLTDPRLEVIAEGSTAVIAANDNWSGTAELAAAFAAQGAFPLAARDSKDAALLVTLAPGTYSAKVSGVGDTTGEALIEIYEVQ